MAYSQIDPSRLEGDDLRRWYMRSPAEIEEERQQAADQRYQDFFGDNRDVDPDTITDDESQPADVDSHPVSRTYSDSPIEDVDPGFTWVADGPNRFRSVPISGDDGGPSPARDPAGPTIQPSNSSARVRNGLAPVSMTRPQPGATTPAPPAPSPNTNPPSPRVAAYEPGFQSPFNVALDAFHNFQKGPKIPRPSMAESFIPVVGPAWEATADLQDGNYAGAAFNGAMAVADALPLGVAVKGLNAARKGITILKDGSVTADAARKMLKARGLVRSGEEVHHTIPLDGLGRNVEDWRNHFAFLKPLPKDIHRRLTGSWMGKPEFDPIRKIWYGTTDWQKAVPTGIAGYAADAWENLTHPFGSPAGGASDPRGKP